MFSFCECRNIAKQTETELKGLEGKSGYRWKKQMSGKEVIAMLKKNGWEHFRTSGSHYIMIKNNIICSVPYHKTIKKGTLASIKRIVKDAESS